MVLLVISEGWILSMSGCGAFAIQAIIYCVKRQVASEWGKRRLHNPRCRMDAPLLNTLETRKDVVSFSAQGSLLDQRLNADDGDGIEKTTDYAVRHLSLPGKYWPF